MEREIEFSTSDGDTAGPITLGITMSRMLDRGDDGPGKDKISPGTKVTQRVVIIGDSDFLSNTHVGFGANLALGLAQVRRGKTDDAIQTLEALKYIDNDKARKLVEAIEGGAKSRPVRKPRGRKKKKKKKKKRR